jgi:DNA repair protein RadC
MARASIAASDPVRTREDRTIYRALRILEGRAVTSKALIDCESAGALFRLSLGDELREHFEAAFLDTKHQLIARERLFSGTIDGAEVAPRIVVQRALAVNAAAVIVAHNHPSGSLKPSNADRAITRRLAEALALVEVRLLDHFVVTRCGAESMAKLGMM